MAKIHSAAQAPEIIEGSSQQVLGVTDVRVLAFRFTDRNGRVDVGLAFCFGKDAMDGGPQVAVVSPAVLKEMLSVPYKHIKDGIRAKLGVMSTAPTEVPEAAFDAELSGVEEG